MRNIHLNVFTSYFVGIDILMQKYCYSYRHFQTFTD